MGNKEDYEARLILDMLPHPINKSAMYNPAVRRIMKDNENRSLLYMLEKNGTVVPPCFRKTLSDVFCNVTQPNANCAANDSGVVKCT